MHQKPSMLIRNRWNWLVKLSIHRMDQIVGVLMLLPPMSIIWWNGTHIPGIYVPICIRTILTARARRSSRYRICLGWNAEVWFLRLLCPRQPQLLPRPTIIIIHIISKPIPQRHHRRQPLEVVLHPRHPGQARISNILHIIDFHHREKKEMKNGMENNLKEKWYPMPLHSYTHIHTCIPILIVRSQEL